MSLSQIQGIPEDRQAEGVPEGIPEDRQIQGISEGIPPKKTA
jgi:hypothetical protein